MAYIEESLGTNEVIVAQARIAWGYAAAAMVSLLAGLVIAGLLLGSDLEQSVARVAAAIAGILGLGLFFGIIIPVWTTEVGVTNQRLIVKRGVLGRDTEELELWSIEEVDLKQNPLDRALGFGRLVISGTGDDDMTLPLISNVLDFRKAVQESINAARPNHPRS